MSRYIDVDKLKSMECADCYYHTEDCPNDCGIMEWIDSVPTADVVSREQFNTAYDESIRLRSINEHLMDTTPNNPYWSRVSQIANRQRAKGILTYGQGLEKNPADIETRLDYLSEELVDALMYIEWIKDKLKEREDDLK